MALKLKKLIPAYFLGTYIPNPKVLGSKVEEIIENLNATVNSYISYTALLTQTSTNDPIAIVQNNELGSPIVWTRTAAGVYRGTLTGAFPVTTKVVMFISGNNGTVITTCSAATPNYVVVQTTNTSGVGTDGTLLNASVEIRVYP